jgi:uncharacterized protein DUF6325
MSLGPVEYIAIGFPGNKFSGKIIPAIQELQSSGTIRVLDLAIISKDGEGNITAYELSEASPEEAALFSVLGGALDPNSTAALMIWENTWAAKFVSELRAADGILIANGRIPAPLIEEALAEGVA